MNILDRAQAQWDARPQHKIEVPEWGEGQNPLVVYFKTPNAGTLSKILRESNGDNIEQAVLAVILCASDSEGKRLFKIADKLTFMQHIDFAVVNRIADMIMKEARLDVGEAAKNSEATLSE